MKKVLMGTTALVAMAAWAVPAAAAEKEGIQIGVGGYWDAYATYVDQDFDDPGLDFHEDNVRQEGEIHFKGETTLDNGLTVGINIQLEAVTQGDQIDEHYVYLEGGWGRFIIGSENSAASLMGYSAPSVGLGVNSPTFYLFAQQNTARTGTYVTLTNDANKLTYFTPRFSGFQLGVSYTPNIDAGGGDRQTVGLTTDSDVGEQANFFAVGANFVESFNGVDVALSGTWERGQVEADPANVFDDSEAWQIGANVGAAGFTIGGSYGVRNNGLAGSSDGTGYDAGVSYETGPWGISVAWLHVEQEMVGGGADDEYDHIEVAGSYALGPGISVRASVQRFDEDSATVNNRSDGWGAALGTHLSF